MKKKQIILISVLSAVLALLITAALILPSLLADQPQEGEKSITFTVVYENGEKKTYDISTNREYLADALFDEGLITESEYKAGFYTIIDGIKADWNKDGGWWCITEDGQMTSKGMNELAIKDGDSFEAVYTKG